MFALLINLPANHLWATDTAEMAGLSAKPSAVVALDGSGQFKSVQEAINAAPQLIDPASTWTIRIKPGTYKELIYVMREKRFIRLIGDDPARTIISGDLYAGMIGHDGQPIGTFRTPTMWIDADDFSVEGVTIANVAGKVGQAVALRIDGDRVVVKNCRLTGWQDTLLVNRGRHYFERCTIAGAVDFIFGGATDFFESCDIECLGDGYITAASTLPDDPFGFVFARCKITGAEPSVRTFLGRPWRAFASTMFIDTQMDGVVRPVGWNNWDRPEREKTSRYVEFNSSGTGANPAARASWAGTLTATAAEEISAGKVLAGRDRWSPAPR
jgi:pectinesterase